MENKPKQKKTIKRAESTIKKDPHNKKNAAGENKRQATQKTAPPANKEASPTKK